MTFLGFLRKSGNGLSRSLLTIFIILAIASFAVSEATNPDFLKPVAKEMLMQQLGQQQQGAGGGEDISASYDSLMRDCSSGGTSQVSLPLEELGKTIVMRCDEIKAAGKDGLTGLFAEKVSAAVFADSYNMNICEGGGCIRMAMNDPDPMKKISAIVNKNFNDYIKGWTFKFSIAAAICALLVLLLSQGIAGRLLALGYPLTVAGLPYLMMGFTQSTLEGMMPASILFLVRGLAAKLSNIFLAMLISGAVLLALGFILKFVLKEGKEKETKDKGRGKGR